MKKKFTTLLSGLLFGTLVMNAVPAAPGIKKLVQPDGTVVEAVVIGDERFHYYETAAGEILLMDAGGTLRPAVLASDGSLQASGTVTGKATPPDEARMLKAAMARHPETASQDTPSSRIAPGPIKPTFSTTGVVTGLILLCEYQDVKLTEAATVEHYDRLCNEKGYSSSATYGSVLDYFTSQSNGKFTPKFDVVGPITLPKNRADYGMTNDIVNQFRDACLEADKMGLDFSKYDMNNDGFVDFLFVVFAGHGQAQGGPYDSVWPAMQDLSNYVFDYFDGLQLGVAACSCELKGGQGTELDGIGTICHEFSHILGLADIYDTSGQGGHGMSHFDIMDVGSYNDNQVTPSGYTAMDKYTLGWLDPIVLDESRYDVTLEPFDTSHQAVFIVNPDNPDEYYTLENRRQQGWDKGIPGHGLVISYCHYDKKHWKRNTVNALAAGYEHVRIVAADNMWNPIVSDEAGDPFPGPFNNTSFSATTVPAAVWQSSGTKMPVKFGISNIRESEDGIITFDYSHDVASVGKVGADGFKVVAVNGNSISTPEGSRVFDISGRNVSAENLPSGIYIVRTADKSVKVRIP